MTIVALVIAAAFLRLLLTAGDNGGIAKGTAVVGIVSSVIFGAGVLAAVRRPAGDRSGPVVVALAALSVMAVCLATVSPW